MATAYAGQDTEFIIEARDIIGNLRVIGDDQFNVEVEVILRPRLDNFEGCSRRLAGGTLSCSIYDRRAVADAKVFPDALQGPSLPQVSVYDRDDGTYLVTYNVHKTGEYHVSAISSSKLLDVHLLDPFLRGSAWPTSLYPAI